MGGCTRRMHPKDANSMAASGLVFRSDLVGTGRAISVLFGINGVRNKQSHIVGPPFPEFKAHFSATAGWHFSRDLRVVRHGNGITMQECSLRMFKTINHNT